MKRGWTSDHCNIWQESQGVFNSKNTAICVVGYFTFGLMAQHSNVSSRQKLSGYAQVALADTA
jgi:hypothetical protein